MNRISTFLPSDNMQYHLRNREWRMNELTNKLGSQTRIKQLRDDPLAAGRAVRFGSNLARMERFSRNAVAVRNHLGYQEGYIRESMDIMQRINEIAVQGANGLWDKSQMGYMAREVDGLLRELVHIANSKTETGDSMFGGFKLRGDAFRVGMAPVPGAEKELIASVDYIGDIGQNFVEISESAFVPLNMPGNNVFWAENQQIYSTTDATDYRVQEDSAIRIDGVEIQLRAGDNVYAIISKINDSAAAVRARLDPMRNSLLVETTSPHQIWPEDMRGGTVLQDLGILSGVNKAPPHNLADSARAYGGSVFDMVISLRDRLFEGDTFGVGGSSLRGVQDSIRKMSGVLAAIGAQDTRLRIAGERLAFEIPEIQRFRSEEVDIDIAEAATDLKMLEYAHKAALSTTARIIKPTLLDFLR